jgi:putative acetyltransferase
VGDQDVVGSDRQNRRRAPAVISAAFGQPRTAEPAETRLVAELRGSDAWLPALSLVAIGDDETVIGHVVCTRGRVGSASALGLGPLSVHPAHQRRGVGSALMHAVIASADAMDEPIVCLLGDPAYYARFGFKPAVELDIAPPDAAWERHFQARTLTTYTSAVRGVFAYAEPFDRL